MKWYFYNEENAVDNLVTPYFITDIQPTNEELLKSHIVSDIQVVSKEKQRTVLKVNVLTKELVVTYDKLPPLPKEEFKEVKTTTDTNDIDINEVIYPYILDIDYQIAELYLKIDEIKNPVAKMQLDKIKRMGGILMTYYVLKKEIRRGALSLTEANDRIDTFEKVGKITKEEAAECRDLAIIYCEM